MFAEPKLIALAGGQQIALDEYGDPRGEPVFFLHGWPASRLQGSGFGPAAEKLGVRILAPDRPGIGLSSLQPNRRLLDWPPVMTALANALGLDRFRVLGLSGGAPYALATAFALSERVLAVGVISGAPPLPLKFEPGDLLSVYRWLLAVERKHPGVLRQFFRLIRPIAKIRPPLWLVRQLMRWRAPADGAAICVPDVYTGSFACYEEAWRGSGLGVAIDGEVHSLPWGFDPEEIRVPATIWHGKSDQSFGFRLAEALAARVPGCRLHLVEGEGHYSLPIRHGAAALEELVQMGKPAEAALLEKT
jgi:pimeloyl-ACP methyl ester carboxylesterase